VLTFLASLPGMKVKISSLGERQRASDSEGASDIRTIEDCSLHLATPPSKTPLGRILLTEK
jgi:hypothetical protein